MTKKREEKVDDDPAAASATSGVAEGSDDRAAANAWGKRLSFRKVVHTIVTGQRIHNEITVGRNTQCASRWR